MLNRREYEENLINASEECYFFDEDHKMLPSSWQRMSENQKRLRECLKAAHKREDAIRALPRFDYRECNSSGDFIDADKLDAILEGES